MTTSVSGRADDLAWRCSSDTFDLNGRAFESSENWAVLSTEGDKPTPRFDVTILKFLSVGNKYKFKSCPPHLYSEVFISHSFGVNSMQQPL